MSEQAGGAEGAREPDSPPGASDSRPEVPEQAPPPDWSRPGGPGYPPSQQPVAPPTGWQQYPPPYPPQPHAPHTYPRPPYPQAYAPAGMPQYPAYAQGQHGRRPPAPVGAPPRIQPVAGTDFGLAYFTVPPVVAGQAIGSMVAGILSILVALVVSCFGLAGARQGWGPIVAGAFAVLAAAAGLAAIGLGWFSVRQITRSGGRLAGRGMAIAGIVCGATGLSITAVAMLLALLI